MLYIWNLISKFRLELMGFATIWVMLFHFRANMEIAPIDWLSSVGYGGVDIFLYLSGFGLYYGYSKNENRRIFYIRRFMRIYPIYLIIIVVDTFLRQQINIVDILLKSIGIGYFFPFLKIDYYDWYIPSLYVLYFLFPFIYKYMQKNVLRTVIGLFLMGICLTALLIIIQKGTVILTISRLPICSMGVFAGYMFSKNKGISKNLVISTSIITIVMLIVEIILVEHFDHIFLWRNAIYWLPFILIIPGLCFSLVLCMNKMDNNIVVLGLRFIGKISLEAYLTHIIILGICRNFIKSHLLSNSCYVWVSFILFACVVFVLSYALNRLYSRVRIPLRL